MAPVIGYRVENKPIGLSGKVFTGVVQVPSGTKSGDCFKQLCNVFGSQNQIERIFKVESIQGFKTKIENERKNQTSDNLLEECKARLLEDDVKWWMLSEVEGLFEKKEVPEEAKLMPKVEPKDDKDAISDSVSKLAPQAPKQNLVERIMEEDVKESPVDKITEKDATDKELNLKEVEIKTLEGKLFEKNEEMAKKNEEIEELKGGINEIDEQLKIEKENSKKDIQEKDEQIGLLGKEIDILEEEIKSLKRSEKELTDERMNWNQDYDSQTVTDLQEELDDNKEKLTKVKIEKQNLEVKLKEVEGKHEETMSKMEETEAQLKNISDNCQYLQAQLVTQKKEMEEDIDKVGKKLIEKTKETEKLKEELTKKYEEVEALKQAAIDNDLKQKEASPQIEGNYMKEQLGEIWKFIQDKSKSSEVVQLYKSSSAYNNTDVQVHRVRSKDAKLLMVGHPELLRNIENITSLRKVANDLINSDHLEIITDDFEGFDMKKLVDQVSGAMEKTSFSEATKEGKSKNLATSVLIFAGNHHVALSVNEKNAGKTKFIKEMKMGSSADALAQAVVEIISCITGKKQIVVVVDPASEATYEYSMIFANRLTKGVSDWKGSMDVGSLPNILIWNLLEEQKNNGGNALDKRNTIAIEEEGGMVWLDKASLTTESNRVSKITTIQVFNRVIDLVSDSPPPADACKLCGIQQSSSYGSKCVEGDVGEYKVCEVCLKDAHDISNCWSMKFQSDKFCKHRSCVPKKLKHSMNVHDIMIKKYQEEAVKELKVDIDFWKSPRLKRPFFVYNREGQEGPEAKRRRK